MTFWKQSALTLAAGLVMASPVIAANTMAVPPKAVMISCVPLAKLSTCPIRRDSIRPMKNVKPSSSNTPVDECLVFSMP